MTYLAAETEFQQGHWYHVVGTYDGAVQRIYVDGKLEREANTQRGEIHYPPQAFYELGAYHDKDEYNRLTGMLHEVRVYRRVLTAKEVQAHYQGKRTNFPLPVHLETGPYAQFTSRHSADVGWRTHAPSPTILEYTVDGALKQIVDETLKTEHRVTLGGLNRGRSVTYRIRSTKDGNRGSTDSFTLETDFNFSVTDIPESAQPYPADDAAKLYASTAKHILLQAGFDRGICLVLGCGEGRLAYELARQSKLRVIGVDENAAVVNRVRQTLQQAGVYGPRITFRQVNSLARLPFVGGCANLVVSDQLLHEGQPPGRAVEVLRLLRPGGGVAILGQPPGLSRKGLKNELQHWFEAGSVQVRLMDDESGLWGKVVRRPLEGAGEWTHLYGRADNSAFGGETLGGVSTATGLRVQWIGRPGPRVQPDRNGRKPSPLSVNGRLFVQGLHRLIGLDAYNGTLLWSLEIPSLERFNMPRDSGNWCADQDSVFAAIRDKCWQIDAQTGQVTKFHPVIPGDRQDWNYDWGYLARVGEMVIGSAVKQGTAFTNFWGNADAGWYDARGGPVTFKVCSENLFALDRRTGRPKWTYQNGVILNSTITATPQRVFFVECRNERVRASTSRRIGMAELWQDQYLVAVAAATGEKMWETPLDVAAGITVFYMAQADDKLVITSSNNEHYDVYGFDAAGGKQVWHQSISWLEGKGDHGKAMSRPAIVGGRVYIRPRVFDLKSGKLLAIKMPAGGCGTYAATSNAFVFRSGNITMWDTTSGSSTKWDRLRPGCWLSTIPAGGMLLSPEAGGGCSCGNWLETSVGFMPSR